MFLNHTRSNSILAPKSPPKLDLPDPRPHQPLPKPIKMNPKIASLFLLSFGLSSAEDAAANADAAATDLAGAESQSFGYGYGTKTADKYGYSTSKKRKTK